jgi:hypothetical protein
MSAERRARRTALLLALLLFASGPAAAENLLKFEVLGLRLGADIARVQARFPDLFVEPEDYEDPEVGFRYEAALGRRAVLRYRGQGPGRTAEGHELELRLAFTGEGLLYELTAWERLAGPADCAALVRGWRRTYGDPDVQVEDQLVQWIERKLTAERMFEIRCYAGEARVLWHLVDAEAEEDWRTRLRADLAPAIEQARQSGPGR